MSAAKQICVFFNRTISFKEEYQRICPLLDRYAAVFSDLGIQMEYGPIDKEQKEELEKSLALETITYDTFNRGFLYVFKETVRCFSIKRHPCLWLRW